MSGYTQQRSARAISRWLFFVMLLVIAVIVVGGATRLTNSGLSITEWKPIAGVFPPLTHAQWVAEFEKYKQIPEFMAEHPDMDLKGFEFIYFMEWGHRMLGRLIGLAYGLPFIYYALRRRLPRGHFMRFFSILILIGVQGTIGWWMVKSGLTGDRVDVSQYRLAAHLGMAFLILGLLFWTWRDQKEGWGPKMRAPIFKGMTSLIALLVYIQILAGAFVAGTHSGKSYNTWPMMDGGFVPPGYFSRTPLWTNLFENTAAIQFNHRVLAYIIVILAFWMLLRARRMRRLTSRASMFLLLVLAQTGLGIWTLLEVAPLRLSLGHQFLAIFVFLSAVWMMRSARRGG